MNSTARDVLNMIGVGLQRGIIKSPDLEMMYSDGPKRVRLIDMVAHALESLPAPTAAAAEQIPEPPRAPLTPPTAHPALAATVDYTEKVAAWERLAFGTRAYYAALAECDAAWERIAAAVGVPAPPAPLNGIAANWFHGEGAIARCSYCGRYSLDPKTLSDRQPACECGEKHGWSGSFRKPGPNAKWSGKAPAGAKSPGGVA